ncbi:MAG TPA: phosphoadenylyl-sulfate reductase [Vicinamibacterales bacterium]|nr:phosphoadenylyl-sulfate reductase [Vicinamibacterales bacterium]
MSSNVFDVSVIDQTVSLIADEIDRAAAPCVTSSFQAEGVVLLHLLQQISPGIPVLFLDTVHHFAETIQYRDELAARWDLNVVTLRAQEPAPGLWRESTEACCARHKAAPLFAALRRHDTWFTGLRRDQSPSRAQLREIAGFTLPDGLVLRKVSPLAAWTKADVWRYAKAHGIRLLPLYDLGFTSIGCEPCTSLPLDPSNDRSGRWGGRKLECGIHVQPRPAADLRRD